MRLEELMADELEQLEDGKELTSDGACVINPRDSALREPEFRRGESSDHSFDHRALRAKLLNRSSSMACE